eukprot:ctg_2040.g319
MLVAPILTFIPGLSTAPAARWSGGRHAGRPPLRRLGPPGSSSSLFMSVPSVDYTTLAALVQSVRVRAVPGRLEAVLQPSAHTVYLGLRTERHARVWLTLSWHPQLARLTAVPAAPSHEIGDAFPGASEWYGIPRSFHREEHPYTVAGALRSSEFRHQVLTACTLMAPWERVVELHFARRPGESATARIVLEVMGTRSNVAVLGAEVEEATTLPNVLRACGYQVSANKSVRPLRVGSAYEAPPLRTDSRAPSRQQSASEWCATWSRSGAAIGCSGRWCAAFRAPAGAGARADRPGGGCGTGGERTPRGGERDAMASAVCALAGVVASTGGRSLCTAPVGGCVGGLLGDCLAGRDGGSGGVAAAHPRGGVGQDRQGTQYVGVVAGARRSGAACRRVSPAGGFVAVLAAPVAARRAARRGAGRGGTGGSKRCGVPGCTASDDGCRGGIGRHAAARSGRCIAHAGGGGASALRPEPQTAAGGARAADAHPRHARRAGVSGESRLSRVCPDEWPGRTRYGVAAGDRSRGGRGGRRGAGETDRSERPPRRQWPGQRPQTLLLPPARHRGAGAPTLALRRTHPRGGGAVRQEQPSERCGHLHTGPQSRPVVSRCGHRWRSLCFTVAGRSGRYRRGRPIRRRHRRLPQSRPPGEECTRALLCSQEREAPRRARDGHVQRGADNIRSTRPRRRSTEVGCVGIARVHPIDNALHVPGLSARARQTVQVFIRPAYRAQP